MGGWEIEMEPEVVAWYRGLTDNEAGRAAFRIDLLASKGNLLQMPHSKMLEDGLCELRFSLSDGAWRITYYFESRLIVLLTVFRKQRMNKRSEVTRAIAAMRRCRVDHIGGDDGKD